MDTGERINRLDRFVDLADKLRSSFKSDDKDVNNRVFSEYIRKAMRDLELGDIDAYDLLDDQIEDASYDEAKETAEVAVQSAISERVYLETVYDIGEYIEIDHKWKQRVQSYLSVIRDIVRKSGTKKSLKDRILSKISDLSAEIEKNRTTTEKFSEVWLAVTEAIGQGANNLDPVPKLIERLVKALSARKGVQENQSLLSPEDAQLPPPEDVESDK